MMAAFFYVNMAITILKDVLGRQRRNRHREERPRSAELFDQLDNSQSRQVQHQKRYYVVDGVRVETPTQVEKHCADRGLDPSSLDYKPMIKPGAGGKADIEVRIEPKT